MSHEQTDLKGFFCRLMYKFSGMKVISFILSGLAVIVVVLVASHAAGKLSNDVVIKAIGAIKDLALGLFIVKGTQNIVGMITNSKTGGNDNGG